MGKRLGAKADSKRIFAESQQCFYLSGRNRLDYSRQFASWIIGQSEEPGAIRIWIAIFAQENVIAGAVARNNVDPLDGKELSQARSQPKLFVGHAAGGEDSNLPSGKMPQLGDGMGNGRLPVGRDQFTVVENFWFEQAAF